MEIILLPPEKVPGLELTFVIFAKLFLTLYFKFTLLNDFNLVYSLKLVLFPIPTPKSVPPKRTDWSRYRLKPPLTASEKS